jgi:hypothetical protein
LPSNALLTHSRFPFGPSLAGAAAARVYLSRRARVAAPRTLRAMADAAAPSSPPRAAETAGEASLRVVCTPEEERIFATLLAAVRHFGARAFFVS